MAKYKSFEEKEHRPQTKMQIAYIVSLIKAGKSREAIKKKATEKFQLCDRAIRRRIAVAMKIASNQIMEQQTRRRNKELTAILKLPTVAEQLVALLEKMQKGEGIGHKLVATENNDGKITYENVATLATNKDALDLVKLTHQLLSTAIYEPPPQNTEATVFDISALSTEELKTLREAQRTIKELTTKK